MSPTVYLGLGSNLGDRQAHLRSALAHLERHVTIEAVSSIYETAPWGVKDQPPFLNAVCRIRTTLAPHSLLRTLQAIETQLGRQRLRRWGPRTIDLDILSYDQRVVETADLVLPHPYMHQRAFVLAPLVEIAPGWTHPTLGKRARELLEETSDRDEVQRSAPAEEIWPPQERSSV